MITTIVILSVLLVVSFYIVWNLLRKVERLEDIADDLGGYVNQVSDLITQSRERIEEIDQKGTFSSDDEVGFFFDNLKEIQNVLNSVNINEPTKQTPTQEERS